MKTIKEKNEILMFLFGMGITIFLLLLSSITEDKKSLISHDGTICECNCLEQ